MSVSIVVQRFRECKLLIDELDYVTVGGGGENCCGILAYISFASTTTKLQVEQAAQTLLNLPIVTTGLWGDGESSTKSILSLAAEVESSCSLVIVPQANLISKVKQMGKSIQYHGQINKEDGEHLYHYFNECIKGILLEEQCKINSQDLPEWYTKRKVHLQQNNSNNNNKQTHPSILPNQLFKDTTKYSEWDEDGLPTKDAEGNAISKSQMKKLKKIYEAHVKRHLKWKVDHPNGNEDGASNEEQQTNSENGVSEEVPQWDDSSLDTSFCYFVAGSFGKRQAMELSSDMGPFVHSFQV